MDHTVQLMLIKCHGTEYYFLGKKTLEGNEAKVLLVQHHF
jgi:hypothetical protein